MGAGGDSAGVRALQSRYGSAATHTDDQGTQFTRALSALNPGNFGGPKGEQFRDYNTHLAAANRALSNAFSTVSAYLPTVADAVEHYAKTNAARIKAAAAVLTAKQAVATDEIAVAQAKAAVEAEKHSPFLAASVQAPGVSATPASNLASAEAQLKADQAKLRHAEDRLRAAANAFREAGDHRKSVLAKLKSLCNREVESLQKNYPASVPPPLGFTNVGLPSHSEQVEAAVIRALKETATTSSSWLSPLLIPRLEADAKAAAKNPSMLLKGSVDHLHYLATRPLSYWLKTPQVPKVHKSGGGSFFGHLAAGVGLTLALPVEGAVDALQGGADPVTDGLTGADGVAAEGELAEAFGGGSAAASESESALASAERKLISAVKRVKAGTPDAFKAAKTLAIDTTAGGVTGSGTAALNDLLHHKPITAEELALGFGTGAAVTALPGAVTSTLFKDDGPALTKFLAGAGTSGAAAGGASVASSLIKCGKLPDAKSLAADTGLGLFGGSYGSLFPGEGLGHYAGYLPSQIFPAAGSAGIDSSGC